MMACFAGVKITKAKQVVVILSKKVMPLTRLKVMSGDLDGQAGLYRDGKPLEIGILYPICG